MKKLIITMTAIAFSLGVFSEGNIYKLDEYKEEGVTLITVWCVNDKTFIETYRGAITQIFRGEGTYNCDRYKREMD